MSEDVFSWLENGKRQRREGLKGRIAEKERRFFLEKFRVNKKNILERKMEKKKGKEEKKKNLAQKFIFLKKKKYHFHSQGLESTNQFLSA